MTHVRTWPLVVLSAAAAAAPTMALAAEHPVSISGDGWVALGIIVVLVAVIALLIRGTLSVADRGETANDDGGGFPWFGGDDDDEDRPKKKR